MRTDAIIEKLERYRDRFLAYIRDAEENSRGDLISKSGNPIVAESVCEAINAINKTINDLRSR